MIKKPLSTEEIEPLRAPVKDIRECILWLKNTYPDLTFGMIFYNGVGASFVGSGCKGCLLEAMQDMLEVNGEALSMHELSKHSSKVN